MNFRDDKILLLFAKRLKQIRYEKGITQEELAYNSGISLSQIARIETGKINPTLCTIVTIAYKLEIDPSELLKFEEE